MKLQPIHIKYRSQDKLKRYSIIPASNRDRRQTDLIIGSCPLCNTSLTCTIHSSHWELYNDHIEKCVQPLCSCKCVRKLLVESQHLLSCGAWIVLLTSVGQWSQLLMYFNVIALSMLTIVWTVLLTQLILIF